MQFMLDIITSLRTNNPQKIPGYDPDRIENMRKLLRTHIKGSLGDNQLKISLQDLLNAEHQGKDINVLYSNVYGVIGCMYVWLV